MVVVGATEKGSIRLAGLLSSVPSKLATDIHTNSFVSGWWLSIRSELASTATGVNFRAIAGDKS